jgi:hypothetical protein
MYSELERFNACAEVADNICGLACFCTLNFHLSIQIKQREFDLY